MQVGNTEIHAHRNVLACVSPHLMELFSSDVVSVELRLPPALTVCFLFFWDSRSPGGFRASTGKQCAVCFCCWNDLESSRCTFPLLLQDTVNGATADGKAPCYRLNGHITLTGLRFLVEYAYTGSLEVPGDMVS